MKVFLATAGEYSDFRVLQVMKVYREQRAQHEARQQGITP